MDSARLTQQSTVNNEGVYPAPLSKKAGAGFTITELTLVIGIIALLSTIALGAINIPKQLEKTRDGQRKSDLYKIATALEQYRTDQNSYPTLGAYNGVACGGSLTAGGITYFSGGLPCDPKPAGTRYTYGPSGSPPQTYTLTACLENANANDPAVGAACGSGGKLYTVRNP